MQRNIYCAFIFMILFCHSIDAGKRSHAQLQGNTKTASSHGNKEQNSAPKINTEYYPPHWQNWNYIDLIKQLQKSRDVTYFIHWCNAIREGIDNAFYSEQGMHEGLFLATKNVNQAVKDSEQIKQLLASYNEHTDFLSKLQRALKDHIQHYNIIRLCNILDDLNTLTKELDPDFISAWQKQYQSIIANIQNDSQPHIALSRGIKTLAHSKQQPTPQLLQTWCDTSKEHMQCFDAQALSNSIWAIATLQRQPKQDWIDTWFNQSQTLLEKNTFNAQALSNSIWALAKLQQRPPENGQWIREWFNKSQL